MTILFDVYEALFSLLFKTLHFFLSPFIFGVCLCEFGFEGRRFPVLFVFVQNVHKVSNVTGSQTKGFDFGQLRIRGHVWDAFLSSEKALLMLMSPAPLLSVCRGFTFHWSGSIPTAPAPGTLSVVRVIEPGGSLPSIRGCRRVPCYRSGGDISGWLISHPWK